MMRITFVVLLCCVAATVASPASQQLLDTLMGEIMDESLAVDNYDEVPHALRKYMESLDKVEESPRVINLKPQPEPVLIPDRKPMPQPSLIPEREPIPRPSRPGRRRLRPRPRARMRPRPIESSRSGSSRSSSRSSGSKMAYESYKKLFDAPLESFTDYLAQFMQGSNCHEPSEYLACGRDERHVIDNPNNMAPHQFICRIMVHGSTGETYGTGFKVKIVPDIGRTVLFTAAHVLHDPAGGYAQRVRIHCPGEAEVIVERNHDGDMWMSEQFLNTENFLYDYAYITYPGESSVGFGFQGFIDDNAIKAAGIQLHACGYPTPSRQNTCISPSTTTAPKLYCHSNDLIDVHDLAIVADIDIDYGETGGPLYDATGDNFVAYGIISLGGCPGRKFQRITAEILYEMFSHMGGIQMNYRLWGTRNIYLHMDGADLDGTPGKIIGGSVYAGFPNNINDIISIVPIHQSSSNQPETELVAIRSATQNNIYLSLDGSGVTRFLLRGGGAANCRYGIEDGAMETFHKEVEPDGQFAFRSTTFNNVYLRLDHWHVRTPEDRGEVNAQFGKFTLETNHPEPVR